MAEKLKDSPTVNATLELQRRPRSRGDDHRCHVGGTAGAYGIASEALALLRGASIIGALESRMRKVPFRTKVPRETGSGTGGAWVGEGLATPAAATAYDTLTQEAYKAGKIVVLSDELLQARRPGRGTDSNARRWSRAWPRTSTRNFSRILSRYLRTCGRQRSQTARRRSVDRVDGGANQCRPRGMLAAITTPATDSCGSCGR